MTEPHPTTSPNPNHPLRPFFFVILVIAGIGAVIAVSKWRAPPELVQWRDNFPQAQADARAQKKPVLLYLTAEWCGPCQEMRRDVFTDQQVADAIARFIPVRVDIDREQALAQKYEADNGIPEFIQFDPQGKIIRRVQHAMDSQQMIAWLKPS